MPTTPNPAPNGPAPIHPLVEEVLRSGKVPRGDGSFLPAHSHIPRDECELLYRQVTATGATRALEVGMAFGVSTLCLCDALARNVAASGKRASLVVMDPAQHDQTWQGIGLELANAAGFGGMLEFHERTSQAVLPELVARGHTVELAFIDGWHTFDHTLVDFFFVDQMLGDSGVIVFDDVGYPSIRRAVQFVLANRSYELVEALMSEGYRRPAPVRRVAKRAFRRLARTDQDPRPRDARSFGRLDGCHSVALRKLGSDVRRWDHFRPF